MKEDESQGEWYSGMRVKEGGRYMVFKSDVVGCSYILKINTMKESL